MVLVFQDKTMERHTEKELQKIDKLSSLSILAGGIAHDFNNILGVILGNVTLATALLQKGQQDPTQALKEAEKATMQAKDLSQQLLTFALGGAPIKKVAPLIPLIQEAANLALAGSHCRAELSLPEDLWLEVPTGTKVFDWTVPDEWSVDEAFIETESGERVVDLKSSNLHLVGYSLPVDARMTLAELRPHLFSLPEHPDWIPYRTSYTLPTGAFAWPIGCSIPSPIPAIAS